MSGRESMGLALALLIPVLVVLNLCGMLMIADTWPGDLVWLGSWLDGVLCGVEVCLVTGAWGVANDKESLGE